ncbi:hypothetical protein Tco_0156314 [Tanacetum coccineum]
MTGNLSFTSKKEYSRWWWQSFLEFQPRECINGRFKVFILQNEVGSSSRARNESASSIKENHCPRKESSENIITKHFNDAILFTSFGVISVYLGSLVQSECDGFLCQHEGYLLHKHYQKLDGFSRNIARELKDWEVQRSNIGPKDFGLRRGIVNKRRVRRLRCFPCIRRGIRSPCHLGVYDLSAFGLGWASEWEGNRRSIDLSHWRVDNRISLVEIGHSGWDKYLVICHATSDETAGWKSRSSIDYSRVVNSPMRLCWKIDTVGRFEFEGENRLESVERQHKQFLAFGLLLCLFGSSSPPFIMLESCEFAKLAICLGRSGSGGGGKGLSMVELGLQGKRDEEDP